jgi:MFS transporter, DHA3 family, macrolide efflux protein
MMAGQKEIPIVAFRYNSPILFLLLSQVFSFLGASLVQFCLVWYLTQATGAASLLTTASLIASLPTIILGPLAGTYVDRMDRKTVLIIAGAILSGTTSWLMLLFSSGNIRLWQILCVLFIRSLAMVFYFPAIQASSSQMVPLHALARLAGWTLTAQGVLGVGVPAVSALLIERLPMQTVLGIDLLSGGLAFLFLVSLQFPTLGTNARRSMNVAVLWGDLKHGLLYVVHWRGLRWVVTIAMAFHLFIVPAFALKPLLVTQYFGGGVMQVGLLDALLNFGIIAGGVILGAWGGFHKKVHTILFGVCLTGVGLLIIGLAAERTFLLCISGMVVVGLMRPITAGPLTALLQSSVEPEMQGRVLTIFNSLSQGMAPLSMLLAGPLSDRFGIPSLYITGGAFCLVMGLAGFRVPELRDLECKPEAYSNLKRHSAMPKKARA